jgi:hypothetical protein
LSWWCGGAGGCCGGSCGAGASGFGVVAGSAFVCLDIDRDLLCSLLTMSITIAWFLLIYWRHNHRWLWRWLLRWRCRRQWLLRGLWRRCGGYWFRILITISQYVSLSELDVLCFKKKEVKVTTPIVAFEL